MATKPPAVRTIYKTDLERREDLDAEIKALRREASDKAKELADLDAEIFAYVKAKADKTMTLVRSGFRLAIATAKKSVAWKKLFCEHHSREEIAEAEAAAGTREVMTIEKL